MSIIHCLFWIKDNMITSLLYRTGKWDILKFKGRKTVPLKDSFWEEWSEYAGMCHEDTVDLCLIYDEAVTPSEHLLSAQCEDSYCIWTRNKIDEAVRVLNITEPTEIRNENGGFLMKTGCFTEIRKHELAVMTARFRSQEKENKETELLPEHTTALIKHYKDELRKYKEGYER